MAIHFVSRGTENYVEVVTPVSGYYNQLRMLQACEVKELVKPVEYTIDGENFLRYPVSGMYILDRYLLKNRPDGKILKQLMKQIAGCALELEKYMMVADDLVIDASLIFVNAKNKEFKFLYVPGHGISVKEQIKKLLEKIMISFDHNDKNGVEYLYRVYHELIEDDFLLNSLLKDNKEECIDEKRSSLKEANKNIKWDDGNIKRDDKNVKWDDGNIKRDDRDVKRDDGNIKRDNRSISESASGKKENLFWKENYVLSHEELETPYVIKPADKKKKQKSIIKYIFVVINIVALIAMFTLFITGGEKRKYAYGIMLLIVALIIQIVFLSLDEDEDEDVAMEEYRLEINKQDDNRIGQNEHKEGKSEQLMFEEKRQFGKDLSDNKNCTKECNVSILEQKMTEPDAKFSVKIKGIVPLSNGGLEKMDLFDKSGKIIFGRGDEGVDYRLCTTQVSRVHASIICTEEGYSLCDNSSTNGTYINDRRLTDNQEVSLSVGDVIRFANEEFLVV